MVKMSPGGGMVDTIDSKSIAIRRGGSIPLQGNLKRTKIMIQRDLYSSFYFLCSFFFFTNIKSKKNRNYEKRVL